jgi:predicted DNA repair protein MutK
MLGGAYLCFEGAEKVYHLFVHPAHDDEPLDEAAASALHLEQEKIAGAVKTDFILSAEIMTIALAALPGRDIWFQAAALAIVGTAITVLVYGGVALIVKADDAGLYMSRRGRLGLTRALGRGIVRGMPGFMAILSAVGTAAMIWVGGSIVIHGLAQIGFAWPEHQIHHVADLAAHAVPQAAGLVTWAVKAVLDGIVGLILGLLILPLSHYVIAPLWQAIRRKPA